HLRGAMAAIISLFMRPVALAIVVLDPFAVNLLHFLPTGSLMEKIVRHSSDDIEHCFYIILPGLFWFNTLFLNTKRLIHLHSLIAVEDRPTITDNRLRHTSSRKGSKEHFQIVHLILRGRNFAGQHRAGVVL